MGVIGQEDYELGCRLAFVLAQHVVLCVLWHLIWRLWRLMEPVRWRDRRLRGAPNISDTARVQASVNTPILVLAVRLVLRLYYRLDIIPWLFLVSGFSWFSWALLLMEPHVPRWVLMGRVVLLPLSYHLDNNLWFFLVSGFSWFSWFLMEPDVPQRVLFRLRNLAFYRQANSLKLDMKMDWGCNGFRRLLEAIQESRTLTEVHGIKVPEPSNPREHEELLESFQQFLENNNSLEELTLNMGRRANVELWASMVRKILAGLDSNATLRSVCLNYWSGPIGSRQENHCPVKSSFSREAAEATIWVDLEVRTHAKAPFTSNFLVSEHFPAANIRHLLLKGVLRGKQNLVDVPALLASAHNLRTLRLEDQIVDPDAMLILEALKTNRSIREFGIVSSAPYGRAQISIRPLLERKFVNKCLEMVEEHNTLLTQCSPWSVRHQRIVYYLALNRFGRGQIRNVGATCQDLLALLLNVQQVQDWALYLTFHDSTIPHGETNMLYGLLRENPGLWSGVGPN